MAALKTVDADSLADYVQDIGRRVASSLPRVKWELETPMTGRGKISSRGGSVVGCVIPLVVTVVVPLR